MLTDGDDLASRVAAATSGSPIVLGLDSVAGATSDRLASSLDGGATLVVYGAMSGEPVTIAPGTLIFKDLSVRAFWLTPYMMKAPPADAEALYSNLDDMVVRGELRTSIDSEFSIEGIKDAVVRASKPGLNGKVVVRF